MLLILTHIPCSSTARLSESLPAGSEPPPYCRTRVAHVFISASLVAVAPSPPANQPSLRMKAAASSAFFASDSPVGSTRMRSCGRYLRARSCSCLLVLGEVLVHVLLLHAPGQALLLLGLQAGEVHHAAVGLPEVEQPALAEQAEARLLAGHLLQRRLVEGRQRRVLPRRNVGEEQLLRLRGSWRSPGRIESLSTYVSFADAQA